MPFIDYKKEILNLSCPKCHSRSTRYSRMLKKQYCLRCGNEWEREDLKEKKEEK